MYDNTVYDGMNVPRVGFESPMYANGTRLIGITPSVIADIWIQINTKAKTVALSPLLSTNKQMTGIAMDDGQVTPFPAGGYSTPITIDSQPRAVGLDTIPMMNDKALFNARLGWNAFSASLYTLDGAVYNVNVPVSGEVVCQRWITPDWTVPALISNSLLTSKSTWIPFMNIQGDRLVVGVANINNAALMTAVMAKRSYIGTSMWLVNGSYVMPNTVVLSGGQNTTSRLMSRPGTLGNGEPPVTPVVAGGYIPQAEGE
jgi:hypothetical protein